MRVMQWLVGFFVLCIAVSCTSQSAEDQQVKVPPNKKGRVSVQLIGPWEKEGNEREIVCLFVHPDGQFSNIKGETLSDQTIVNYFRESDRTESKTVKVRLRLKNQSKTSIDTLVDALNKLSASADPGTDNVVYLFLDRQGNEGK